MRARPQASPIERTARRVRRDIALSVLNLGCVRVLLGQTTVSISHVGVLLCCKQRTDLKPLTWRLRRQVAIHLRKGGCADESLSDRVSSTPTAPTERRRRWMQLPVWRRHPVRYRPSARAPDVSAGVPGRKPNGRHRSPGGFPFARRGRTATQPKHEIVDLAQHGSPGWGQTSAR